MRAAFISLLRKAAAFGYKQWGSSGPIFLQHFFFRIFCSFRNYFLKKKIPETFFKDFFCWNFFGGK